MSGSFIPLRDLSMVRKCFSNKGPALAYLFREVWVGPANEWASLMSAIFIYLSVR